ncbi:endo-1,4-beta-xylanase [Parapedobacter composti]|uniref:Beta-xylanase n=1 Tax=Parapedobacter composti TaxID=623281 RepID=A0A1I1K357_9SPHI|nr:endo-1,4-beta-xylanase [Parapedobacter composti]SFC55166.1 endo-1,4-beta-xylanase [Parapedobacter composti]
MKVHRRLWLSVACTGVALFVGCQGCDDPMEQHITLKQVFQDDFLVGTALSLGQINETDAPTDSLIKRQFNAITAENIMKAEIVHPEWDRFDFEAADKFVAYGRKNNMHIVGHTLIWHSQLPPFVSRISSADSLRQFMQHHIGTVAGRYADEVDGWDVVNEALNEDGSLRQSIFYNLLGEQYLVDAFKLAEEAAPSAELYYNDYNNEQPAKREGCIALIKKLQEAGARIDGVGIQGHWHAGRVPFDEIEKSIEAYAALGLKVMITELDLEVLPRDFQGADVNQRMAAGDRSLNPYADGLPDSVGHQLAADYENLFKLFLKHKDKISRVTFWGVNDGQSWLNYWPIAGRTNYPLLFDRNNQPKEAFRRVVAIKNNFNR